VYVEVVWLAGGRLDGPISFCLPYPDYFYTPLYPLNIFEIETSSFKEDCLRIT